MDEQDVKIAVLDTKIEGIREQQKAHAENTDKKFERMFEYMKPISKWVEQNSDMPKVINALTDFYLQNKEMPGKVEVLWNTHQQQKGFLSSSKLFAGAIGGLIAAVIDFFFGRH